MSERMTTPNKWNLLRLDEVFQIARGGSPRPIIDYITEEDGYNWIKIGDTKNVDKYIYKTKQKIRKEGLKKSLLVKEDDFILSNSMSFGKPYIMKTEGCIHDGWLLLRKRKKDISVDFMYYVLSSDFIKTQFISKAAGSTVQNLNIKLVETVKALIPPLPEQQKIAEILSTIDDKIEVIDQQIIETQTLKKGLMQRLLTKGIGHTEFKDSPFGMIPESWEVVPIYELRNKNDRYGFTGGPFGSDLKSEHYTETGVKIIQLQNIGEGKFIDKGIAFTSENKADELHSCNIFPNEIILAKMAPVARCCKVPSTDERYVMCSDGIRLSIDTNKYDNEFVFQALNSKYFRDEAESKSTGTTRARIGLKELKLIPILIPKDIQEQKEVALILSTVDDKLNVLSEKKSHYQELKQGLMQQLLTGKIRVKV
jgi:type I restriction enzyme S subunit